MGFHVLPGALDNFTFALVAEGFQRIVQRQPEGSVHLNPHLRWDVAQSPGAIQQQVKADDLEDARVITPVAHVEILDVGELADQFSLYSGDRKSTRLNSSHVK